ncbi:barstar family protein [Myceligenerans crystallogenes]|uniref:Barstar (barnase inhibitor) domain-containing protein n=1 Tax=Myceligenerans crystallogenes TaxID=316335 RepID=A0ABN2NHR3_9MICO
MTDDLPVRTLDGASFTDFEGFAAAFSRLLDGHTWTGNLDAFNDILRGGFGTPENGWILRWTHSAASRAALGPEKFDVIVEILRDHGPGGPESASGIHLELS